jgi:DNA repair protein RadC
VSDVYKYKFVLLRIAFKGKVAIKVSRRLLQSHKVSAVLLKPETAETASAHTETAEALHLKRLSRISRRIRSHIRNGFSPLIRGPRDNSLTKNPRAENLMTLSLLMG